MLNVLDVWYYARCIFVARGLLFFFSFWTIVSRVSVVVARYICTRSHITSDTSAGYYIPIDLH